MRSITALTTVTLLALLTLSFCSESEKNKESPIKIYRKTVISEAFKQAQTEFKKCHKPLAQKTGAEHGSITIDFMVAADGSIISPSGQPGNPEVLSNSFKESDKDNSFTECILKTASGLKVTAPPAGKPVYDRQKIDF